MYGATAMMAIRPDQFLYDEVDEFNLTQRRIACDDEVIKGQCGRLLKSPVRLVIR